MENDLDENDLKQLLEDFYTSKEEETKSSKPSQQKYSTKNYRPPIAYEKTSDGKLQCPHCPRVDSSRHHLTNHVYLSHGRGSEKIPCPVCGKNYSRNYLFTHRRIHRLDANAGQK